MDLLPLGFAVLCLWGIRIAKPFFSHIHEDSLSTDSTLALRGLLALAVVLSHLSQRTGASGILGLMGRVGYLAVSVFFFLSGYGLQKQHMSRENYARGFLPKRLWAVAVPYLLVTLIFCACYSAQGKLYSWSGLLTFSIMPYSWYIGAILVFYGAFWLLMRLCGKNYRAMLWGGAVWFAVYSAVCAALRLGTWWYISSFPAVIGMIWAVYEQPLGAFLQKYYFPAAIAVFAGLGAMLVLPESLLALPGMEAVIKSVITSLFSVAVVLLVQKIRLGNPVLRYLGRISMEVYLLQGMAMMLLRCDWLYIENDLLYCALVLPANVALAAMMHMLMKLIHKHPSTG